MKVKVSGLKELRSSLNKYAKEIEESVKQGSIEGANLIANSARSKCSVPSISSTIQVNQSDDDITITTRGEISAYLEFGTGVFAKTLLGGYPQDWVNMASKFYINGLGRMPAKPYLYPAFNENKQNLLMRIKEKVESI